MIDLEVCIDHQFDSGFHVDAAFTSKHRITALFGPSGAGKTTVLNAIAGLLTPKAGRIVLNGKTLFNAKTNVPPRHRRIGYVFQDHLLFPHLSVADNLRFGMSSKSAVGIDAVVGVLELGGLLDSDPSQLSGGQKQRVALGRALLSNPELLLLDEPLASLDSALKDRVLDYLEDAAAEFRIPAVFVSHSQSEVRRLAPWAVVLKSGKVMEEGPPEEVLSRPTALELHDGAGPMNLVRLDSFVSKDGERVGSSNGLELRLPRDFKVDRTPVFAEFEPREVTLAVADVEGVSARNQLHGKIVKTVVLANKVFVAVDVGQLIWAEVTASAVAELNLAVGRPVVCLIKTQSLRLA